MADSLPLIPRKRGAVCADVRPVLREVFKEIDVLPPLCPDRRKTKSLHKDDDDLIVSIDDSWITEYDANCKIIWDQEEELKQMHANRISRKPLPNIYKLYSPSKKRVKPPVWKTEQGIIDRQDLIPTLDQNAVLDECLWVKNILNNSSGCSSCVCSDDWPKVVIRPRPHEPLPEDFNYPIQYAVDSVSLGELGSKLLAPTPATTKVREQILQECILCVPPQLDFINFTVGNQHTQGIRLVNVTKLEIRLSLRPPSRRELDVQLTGTRGLTVTAGAQIEILVHFKPRDVRLVRDELLVRVSTGQNIIVPIICYMQPPLLDILVPAVAPSIMWGSKSVESGLALNSECVELGAKLLGDVHYVPLLFHCTSPHATFFLLTEDSWLSFCLDSLTSRGVVVADSFWVQPAWWGGGGAARGAAWCYAQVIGLHSAALRVLCSTAVVRQLYLLADALYFATDHITLQAQDKDYDICSDDDPGCEYYVHLGTAFPRRLLSATVQLVNQSPVTYSYYWVARPWGVCNCANELTSLSSDPGSEDLCIGALEQKEKEMKSGPDEGACVPASLVRVEPEHGSLAPRSAAAVQVCAPSVGEQLGVQRAVLMLVLKDIPKESFPPDFEPVILKTDVILSDPIPGVERWSREVCDVICGQMEVWWEVVPVRFTLDPPVVPLQYSRRMESVNVEIRATQLFGSEGVLCGWRVPENFPPPAPLSLALEQSCETSIKYPLPALPNELPVAEVIVLEAAGKEFRSSCEVRRACATRHPALQPPHAWLGVLPPAAHAACALHVLNDTHQPICWWADPVRWIGENYPSAACAERPPCPECCEPACTCAFVRPTRGALATAAHNEIKYEVNTPQRDGCVATLVRVQRTEADTARAGGGAGTEARAALVAYRVLAPRLVMRVHACTPRKTAECESCLVDAGALGSASGTAALRPAGALALGRRTCYRLHFTNLTPLPTTVTWEPPLEEDVLRITFCPKKFEVGSYAQLEIPVVVEARAVSSRRLHVRRARVLHAHAPLYLLVDAAVAGLEITCEVPLGGGEATESTLIMRRTQAEVNPLDQDKLTTKSPKEIFKEEDEKRIAVAKLRCKCVSETNLTRSQSGAQSYFDSSVEILWPSKTATIKGCRCDSDNLSMLPLKEEPYCLQFHKLPLRTVELSAVFSSGALREGCADVTRIVRGAHPPASFHSATACVRTRILTIRNESVLCAAWSVHVRRWPKQKRRVVKGDEEWSDADANGVCVQCVPSSGFLSSSGVVHLRVSVYAATWGLYTDQILIQIEKLEPIILDVWIEAVGSPLQFALNLSTATNDREPALCWMSASDPDRMLRVKNVSCSSLVVFAYIATGYDYPQDTLPFRVYIRFFDVQPFTCQCGLDYIDDLGEDESVFGESSATTATSLVEEMDIGIELFLAPDYGVQDSSFYTVTPEMNIVSPGEWATWDVTLHPPHGDTAPDGAIFLRALPVIKSGEGWYRPEPATRAARLRQAVRAGRLRIADTDILVQMCAIHMPLNDVLRIRKRFRVQNVGSGPLSVSARVAPPWSLAGEDVQRCDSGCMCVPPDQLRHYAHDFELAPTSSLRVCVEARLATSEWWPTTSEYEERRITTTKLYMFDDDNVLETIPLKLDIEYPKIEIQPILMNFGFVTDGDTRKSYFVVKHSSHTESLDLLAEIIGGEEFQIWPARLTLDAGRSKRIYIQYTARWQSAPVESSVCVRATVGAGMWCRATARARASPARDLARRQPPHDYTDDVHLLPPGLPGHCAVSR